MKYLRLFENIDFEEDWDWEEEDDIDIIIKNIKVGDTIRILPKLKDYIIERGWHKSMYRLINKEFKINDLNISKGYGIDVIGISHWLIPLNCIEIVKKANESFDFEEDWEEYPEEDKKVIVFGNNYKNFVGEIIKFNKNYNIKLLSNFSEPNLNFSLGVIGISSPILSKIHNGSRSTTIEELKKIYDVIIVNNDEIQQDIVFNPEKYINK